MKISIKENNKIKMTNFTPNDINIYWTYPNKKYHIIYIQNWYIQEILNNIQNKKIYIIKIYVLIVQNQ